MPKLPDDLTRSQLFAFDSLAGTVAIFSQSGDIANTDNLFNLIWPAGKVLDKKYEIVSLLGEGGMGAVYRAHHLQLDKEIALKTFKSRDYSAEAWRLFEKEVKTLARLNSPNIIQIFDFGFTEDRVPFFTMELLQGQTLAQKLEIDGYLSPRQAMPIFIQLCKGLEAAHKKGILHRDIKPANVFLQEGEVAAKAKAQPRQKHRDNSVKILDFGIATLTSEESASAATTQSGACYGSPLYMSPEQASGEHLSAAADVYACGCSLYQTLTGAPPLRGETVLATLIKHQQEVPASISAVAGYQFPQRLERLVAKMLHKDPAKRPQSMQAVAHELEEILNLSLPATEVEAKKKEGPIWPLFSYASGQLITKKQRLTALGISLLIIAGATAYSLENTKKQTLETKKVRDIFAKTPMATTLPGSEKTTETKITVQKYLVEEKAGVSAVAKHFRFPQKDGIGTISFNVDGKSTIVPMTGDQYVPSNKDLFLYAKRPMAENPELFDGFGPNDLQSVRLENLSGSDLVSDLNWRDDQMRHICRLTSLRDLRCSDTGFTASILNDLNKLSGLQYLTMSGLRADLSWLSQLKCLRQLKLLALSEAINLKPVLAKLDQSSALEDLTLKHSDIDNEDLKSIARIKGIWHLNLSGNRKIDDAAIPILAKLKNLNRLDVEKTSITRDFVKHLGPLKTLLFLTIDWAPGEPDDKGKEILVQGRKVTIIIRTDLNAKEAATK